MRRLGFIGIIVEDKELCSSKVNDILSNYAHLILARTGIPNIKDTISIITLVINATTDEVGELTGKLGTVNGISVKSGLSKK